MACLYHITGLSVIRRMEIKETQQIKIITDLFRIPGFYLQRHLLVKSNLEHLGPPCPAISVVNLMFL